MAKFVIERDWLYTENANRSHGHGALHLSSFEPYAKNPPISKVFREIGLADEPGSGMRNTYKYTKLYSGGTPEFIEGDVFRTVVGYSNAEIEKFSTASLITRTTNDIQQVQFVCVMLLRMVAYAPILGIGGILHVAGGNTGLTWIIFVAVAALLLLIAVLMNVAMPQVQTDAEPLWIG